MLCTHHPVCQWSYDVELLSGHELVQRARAARPDAYRTRQELGMTDVAEIAAEPPHGEPER